MQESAEISASGALANPQAADKARLSLYWFDARGAMKSLAIPPGTWTVGRAEGCDLRIVHSTISRHHAVLSVAPDGSIRLRDLESSNGTRIDDEPIAESRLENGATISFGTVEMEVRIVSATR